MSDMAPNMSGTPAVDIPRAMYLVELALKCVVMYWRQWPVCCEGVRGEGFDEYLRKFAPVYEGQSS